MELRIELHVATAASTPLAQLWVIAHLSDLFLKGFRLKMVWRQVRECDKREGAFHLHCGIWKGRRRRATIYKSAWPNYTQFLSTYVRVDSYLLKEAGFAQSAER